MPLLQVPHGRLYYETCGEGRDVALLHGMWSSHASWRKVVPELSRTHRVLLLDHMGHGRSDRLRVPYSLSTYASDLDILFNHLAIERVSVVGFSLGGLIAEEYYFLHPEKVAALVLVATPPSYRLRWRIGIIIISLLERLGISSVKQQTIKAMSRRQSAAGDRELIDRSLRELASYDDDQFSLIVRSAWSKRNAGRERQIRVPTLIIVGEKDAIRGNSTHLHRVLPRSRLVVVPECDHSLIFTRPELLAGEIAAFLSELPWPGDAGTPSP